MTEITFLALDVGTTHVKAGVLDAHGRVLAAANHPTPVNAPAHGRAEHDPDEFWRVCAELIREVIGASGAAPAAVSIASMGEVGTIFGADNQPLYPMIAWYDTRTEPQVKQLLQEVGKEVLFRITGQSISQNMSLTRLMWLRENEPALFARAARWMNVPDWIRYKLCGEIATDYTIASRMMLFAQERRDWSDELLARTHIPRSLLPRLVPSGTAIGNVTRQAAQETGLPETTQVVTGGHDHLVAALGAGMIGPGMLLDSSGTAESAITVLPRPLLHDEIGRAGYASYAYTARNLAVIVGGLKSSGGMVEWFIDQFCAEERHAADESAQSVYQLLMAQVAGAPGANGVMVVPDFTGSGTPSKNPLARGAFFGLTVTHTKGDILQAMIESTCYWLRNNLAMFERVLGQPIHAIRAVGGGTKNPFWLQTKANITGRVIEIPQAGEASLRGAAMLAGIGAGVFADEAAALASMPVELRAVHPVHGYAAQYDALFPAWLAACEAARSIKK
ncbi:MAG TPA: FGGY family carbohydrate kinase [Thermoflexales bacterium]|nr:FGGY family carbohydrate kinase [Thermoflexales bacterium]